MKTFTQIYLDRISEALIDKAVREGKWMTQAEVERHHQVPYRGGVFMVRRRRGHPDGEWRVSWDSRDGDGKGAYIFRNAKRAVTAFEEVRREANRFIDGARANC